MYYWKCKDKSVKVVMHPGRFVGSAWSIGDPVNFKVLHCNEYQHKRNIFFTKVPFSRISDSDRVQLCLGA